MSHVVNMNSEHFYWCRDWALFGAATAVMAPLFAIVLLPEVSPLFCAVASVLALASGAVVGGLQSGFLSRMPRRLWPVFGLLVVVPLAGWGSAVAATAAMMVCPNFAIMVMSCGSLTAAAQLFWFAPLYGLLSAHRYTGLPLVGLAMVFAPVAGYFSMFGTLAILSPMGGSWLSGLGV